MIMYLQKYILYLFHRCLIIPSCEISQRLYFIWILCLLFMLYIILCILCLRFPIFSNILSAHQLNTWFFSLVLLFKHNSIRQNYYSCSITIMLFTLLLFGFCCNSLLYLFVSWSNKLLPLVEFCVCLWTFL